MTDTVPTPWKERMDKLTYGLIYPAFIGNMIYDFILFCLGKAEISWSSHAMGITTAASVIFFYMLDYVHLSVDLEKIAKQKGGKSFGYIAGDILVSFAFFIAFVMFKIGHITWGLAGITIVPVIFWYYNYELKNNARLHFFYALAVLLLFLLHFFLFFSGLVNSPIRKETSVMIISLLAFIAYFLYNVFAVWCRKTDQTNN